MEVVSELYKLLQNQPVLTLFLVIGVGCLIGNIRNMFIKTTIVVSLLSISILFILIAGPIQAQVELNEGTPIPSEEGQGELVSPAVTTALEWPRIIEHEKGRLKVYQPQIEMWDKDIIEYRMAIEITLTGETEPSFGALWIKGGIDTDKENRLVQLTNFTVSKINLPSIDPEKIGKLEKFINDMLTNKTHVASLDRLLAVAASDPDAVSPKSIEVNLQPPRIIVSQTPAVLLTIDGDPLLQPIGKSGLSFVANANMDLFYYTAKNIYYLFIGEQWLSTSDLEANWLSNTPPGDIFKKIPDDYERAYIKDLTETTSNKTVTVQLAKPPAELILIDGPPSAINIPGTSLMYVSNTEQNVFIHRSEGLYYYMSSGRWFRSRRLEGPWISVDNDLPDDFSKIPDEHPKASVRVSVPGTPESKEAVIEATIPRKIKVDRAKTTVNVTYSGEPEFKPVEGTKMAYAVNTTKDVIQLENKYYCCFQGVWFISDNATGPWKVCDTLPEEIYTIPPNNPKHYVTYVSVYGHDPETVTFGYTGGYTGTYVSNGTVVHGTGYYYPSYVIIKDDYPYYYWYPATYCYWGYSHYYYGGPYYYYPPYYYGHTTYHYGEYGSGYTYQYGPYSKTEYSGKYKDTTFKTDQYKGPYGHWGESEIQRGDDWVKTWHQTHEGRTVGGIETSKGGKGGVYIGDEHRGGVFRSGDNDLYVGRDGNLYRHDENGWSKHDQGDWKSIDWDKKTFSETRESRLNSRQMHRSDITEKRGATGWSERKAVPLDQNGYRSIRTAPSRDTYSRLQRDRSARSRGDYRTRQRHSMRSSASRGRISRGGGGFRGRR